MELTYLKKINRAAKAECIQRRKIRLIIMIFLAVGGLFMIIEYRCPQIWLSSRHEPYLDGAMGMFLLCMAAFFGIFAVHGIFSDLTSRQQADIQMSLPMSAKDRYMSKILALCKVHIFPLIISCLAVMVLCVLKACLGISLHDGVVKASLSSDMIIYLSKFMIIILLIALFTDSVTVFCMTCCGAKAEGIYTSLITMFCVSATPFLFYTEVISGFSGVSGIEGEGTVFMCWGLIPVFAGLDFYYDVNSFEYMGPMLINILVSCVVIWASYFIYKKRDARSVGKPMAFSLFFELFMFMGAFTLFTISFFSSMWTIGATIALIISLIIRIVVSRAKVSIKSFGVWVFKYAVCVGLFIGITAVGYYTGGFGLSSYKPDLSDTCMVESKVFYRFWTEDDGSTYTDSTTLFLDDKSGDDYDVYADIIEKYRDKAVRRYKDFYNCIFYGDTSGDMEYGYVDVSYDILCVREKYREEYEYSLENDEYVGGSPYYESYTIEFRLAKQDAVDMYNELTATGGEIYGYHGYYGLDYGQNYENFHKIEDAV